VSTAASPVRFARELRDICGAPHVIEDPARLDDARVLGVTPGVAVEPASAEEVAAVLHFANEHELTVVPAGGFTQQQTGNIPRQIDVLLYTTRVVYVEHYDPADLTIGVGAGFTVAQLSAMVRADRLLFPGDSVAPKQATIGGLLATGMTGPLRHGYGGLRDYCIGIKFVTGDGRTGKGGGRVVKNVAGYDLMKLLIGSWGRLAVITGASFKLFPAPRQTRTFIAEFATAADAIQYRNAVLCSPLSPMCLELLSPEAGALLPGAASAWAIYVRATGSDAVLARYRSVLGSAITREIDGQSPSQSEDEVWRALENCPHTLAEQHPDSLVLSLLLPLKEVQPALHELESVAASNGMKFAAIGRVGVGHLLIALWPGGESRADPVAAASDFRSRLPPDASMAVVYGARRNTADLWRTPTHMGSMRAVKTALDPKDILNRGRFVF
jgi:glycolate oxidase FAD binding subunit